MALLVLGSVGGFLGNRLSRSHEARAYALAAEQQARGRAEEAVRARDEFLGIAAHELRNPVAGLKGMAQLLERSLSQGRLDEERLRGCVESLVETSSRLARLVDDLLDVSRLEHGRLAVRPEPVDLPSLVREIVSEHLDDGARTHPVRLTGETTLIVPVDPERFRDLLNNLLSNAEKYSEDSAEIVVSLEREDSTVAVTVADGGMGIPREALGTIFEPFGRASNAERANIPGLGLGLYLSRHIAEAHGGNLEATSEGEGRGSAFTFRLPCPAEGQ